MPLRLFYSCASQDQPSSEELEAHLRLLNRQGLIDDWHAGHIAAGAEWAQQLTAELERADIIVLLISADYLASDRCYGAELPVALARHAEGSAHVIPILVRSVELTGAPFGGLKLLPENGRPVAEWPNRDQAWTHVAQGIRQIVERRMQCASEMTDAALAHLAPLLTPDPSPSPVATPVTGNIIGSIVVTGNSNRVSVGRFDAGPPKRR